MPAAARHVHIRARVRSKCQQSYGLGDDANDRTVQHCSRATGRYTGAGVTHLNIGSRQRRGLHERDLVRGRVLLTLLGAHHARARKVGLVAHQHHRDICRRAAGGRHTAQLILYIHKEQQAGTLFTPPKSHEYAECISLSKRKRDNMDPATTWQVMLTAVPGMSANKAKAVVFLYPSMSALTSANAQQLAKVLMYEN